MLTHRPLLGVAVFLSAGIAVGQHTHLPMVLLSVATVLFLILSLAFIKKGIISGIFIAMAFLFLGAVLLRGCQYLPKDHIIYIAKYYKKDPVLLEGIIVSDVQKRDFFRGKKTIFELEVKRFKTRWGWKEKKGKVLVNLFREEPVAYGDYVILEGKLYRPFNFSKDPKFTYRDYLDRRGIKLIVSVRKDGYCEVLQSGRGRFLKSLSLKTKNRLARIFMDNLPKTQAGLIEAMILGDRYNLPKHIMDLFIKTGTAHIIAISGQNMTIVAFITFLVLRVLRLKRTWQHLLTIVFLVFYAFLTGAQPSVVRATIMATVFILSFLIERETDSINSLSLAAILILVFNPRSLFDVGFQLSFICVLAILIFYPRIIYLFSKSRQGSNFRLWRFLVESLAVSLAAWVGVAGLIAYYFNIITPITILANLIVVPCLSAIMVLGFGLLAVGLLCPGITFIFAHCLSLVLNVMVGSIYLFSHFPKAYVYLTNVSLWHVVTYYSAVIAATLLLIRLTKRMNYDTVNPIT